MRICKACGKPIEGSVYTCCILCNGGPYHRECLRVFMKEDGYGSGACEGCHEKHRLDKKLHEMTREELEAEQEKVDNFVSLKHLVHRVMISRGFIRSYESHADVVKYGVLCEMMQRYSDDINDRLEKFDENEE